MTIFDYIGSIINTKKKIELNCDDESQFSIYMINRWLSFYSNDVSNYVNETCNKYANLFSTKQEQYDFLYHVLPKLKFKKINYLKKVKKEDKEEKEKPYIPEFMSRAEYERNLELLSIIGK